jgi:hypothetical protein
MVAMSTFYLLPPRRFLIEHFAAVGLELFPGLSLNDRHWSTVVDAVDELVATEPEVFVVYREELPQGVPPLQALQDGFGAERGDEVVEVKPGGKAGEWRSRRWCIESPGCRLSEPLV